MPRLKNRTMGICAVPPKRILCPQKTRARERERGHVRRQAAVRDQPLDLFARFGIKILVRIQPQNPRCLDRQIVERPVELLGMIPRPCAVDDRCAHRGGDLVAAVRRVAVHDEDLPRRKRREPLQTPLDVEFLVFLEDNYSEICFSC